jgi:hypothetical protein
LTAWLAAFSVTQVVECPIYGRALAGHRWRWPCAFGLSAVTHPIVFFVLPRLFPDDYWTYVSVAEAFAVAVEALLLRTLGVPLALGWALVANGASLLVGLSLRAWIGWP